MVAVRLRGEARGVGGVRGWSIIPYIARDVSPARVRNRNDKER